MSDYRNIGQDPYKGLKPEKIEKDRQDKEKFENNPKRKGLQVFAKIILLYKQIVTTLSEWTNKASSASIDRFVKQDLEEMKKSFEVLKKLDCSQDMDYISQLPELWHQFIEDGNHYKDGAVLGPLIQNWISEIKNYPPNQEHSLGFYLMEYADHKWLPFPYMEMLRDLHLEHQKNPDQSKLNQWTKALDEIAKASNALKVQR